MPHTIEQFWHDHAGARWLTPFAVAILAVIATIVLMLVYPHVSS